MSPPEHTDEVVAWLLGDGHVSLLDSAGRPLGERASPRYGACPVEERVLAFGDLRDDTGLPANIAALRQVAGCFMDCLPAFGAMYAEQPADHARLRARTEAMCLVAPLAVLRHASEAADVQHASAFKLCLGFREMQNEFLLSGRDDAEAGVDVDVVMQRLGGEPLLVGDAQVCAGSLKQIRQVLRALLDESEPTHAAWDVLRAPWFEAAVTSVTLLHEMVALTASTALGLFEHGIEPGDSVSGALATTSTGPRISRALRARTDGAPLRVTLLHRPEHVPSAVRAMVEALAASLHGAPSLLELDAILLEHAGPPARTLMQALGKDTGPLTLEAFRSVFDSV